MHYPWNAFSTTGRDTVKPLRTVPRPGPYVRVSPLDVKQTKLFYKCATKPPVVTKTPPVTKCVTETVNAGGNSNCRDESRSCRYWAGRGECRRNPGYMMKSCCKSCGGGGGGNNNCRDNSASCRSWAARGECRRNPGYMNSNCRLSCRLCTTTVTKKRCYTLPPPSSTTTTEEILTPPIPTTELPSPPIPKTEPPTPSTPKTKVPPTKPEPPPIPSDCIQNTPLGIAAGVNKVGDLMLIASSSESRWHAPKFGRLNQKSDDVSVGAWCAAIQDKKQYFQVDMENVKTLSGLKIQGRPSKGPASMQKFIRKFKIEYYSGEAQQMISVDAEFDGNVDGNSIKEISFEVPIQTNQLRIIPLEWQHMICMRLEIMLCNLK